MIGRRVDIDPAIVAFAEEVGAYGPVAVEGGRTRWDLGGELHAGTRLVRAPSGVVSHRPEEMTVTVRAGATVAELHAAVAAAGQRTALPERGGTVGGAIAVGENDLRVLARGRVAASVLQVRYVSAEGRVVTGGAPTVKNVTGFDLPRLIVGSLGTIGLVAEAILRTNPVPPTSVWLRATGVDPFAVRDALGRPSAVLWDGSTTWVHLEGHAADVAAERRVLASRGTFEEVEGPPPLPPHRWSLRPGELRALDAASTGEYVACVGVGLVFASQAQPPRAIDAGARAIAQRIKAEFDPSGRLNPGRFPGGVPTGASR